MSDNDPTSLQEVARAALDKHEGVSGRQLDVIAKKRGLKIVYTTINGMAAGTYKSRPGRQTLEALAELSGYSLEQVYRAARLPVPLTPLREDLPPDADLLTGSQRRVVIDTIRLFAQQNKQLATLRGEQEGGGEGDERGTPSTSEPDVELTVVTDVVPQDWEKPDETAGSIAARSTSNPKRQRRGPREQRPD